MKNVVLYLTDTLADWEYGYAAAGLGMAEQMAPGRYRLVTASDREVESITTMGGVRMVPDTSIDDLDEADIAMLVLIGGGTWESGHDAVLGLAARLLDSGTPVAAICGATLALARTGLLDERDHTSNAAEFLSGVAGYAGESRYVEAKAVADRDVITAPAAGPVDFAKAIFERLELFPQPITDAWYGLYTTGERRYYDQLMGAAS
ncbi:MAG: DJ-1/PfpI family protein [Actinomycetia bacterium]|nr:DJ-1/PfpI family protein [Actinomycetes bacterium]